MKMSDKPKDLRPREKLQKKGAQALSDLELLQALIGSGNKQADVTKISKDVLKLLKENGGGITLQSLSHVSGIGIAKGTEIIAAFELARRYLLDSEAPIIDSAEKAVEQLADIRDKKQEYFVCMTLDGANRLIAKRIITIGTLNASLVHPREVFADAITDRAASIIIAHNHPSETLTPSGADAQVTQRVKEAGNLLGINLTDHVIITKTDHYSFTDDNKLQ
jgi:DNA repair protein RadC